MENYQNNCFISSVVKALSIKKKLKLYNLEKECAGNRNLNDNRCLCPKYSKYCSSGFRTKNLEYEKNGFLERFFIEDSMENFVVKSAFGFIGGILLTYICFMFLVFSLNFTLKRATYICMGLGIILSLGLAFSVKIRCTVFLCIPQLFSKRGRQALLAYAFILALSGPAKNTLHNVEVMSESLACGQEQLKQAENEVLKCVQKPNAAAKKSVEKLLEKINSAVRYFKNFIFQLYRNCFDILETVLHAQKWLYSISFLCHKKIGRPTPRCLNFLSEASENCQGIKDSLEWKKLCEIRPFWREQICYTEQEAVCYQCDVAWSFPISKLQKQLLAFKSRATNIYSVKLEAHQTYSQYNRTNIYHEEYQGMATEIRQKTDQFLQYFDFMSVIFGIFILVLFVKVIIYRHKFLTEDHYDNRFITSDFVDIDDARAEFKMETLLPLTPREKMKYIKVTSFRLVPCEKVRLLSSFVFLIFATFKIIIHMLTDSSLYWILSSVRQDERLLYMNTLKVDYPSTSVKVFGNGLTASLIQNVTRAVKEHSNVTPLDPTPCLPDPVPPDWNRYYQILALVLICWLLALCEPYGLRLRHSVMVTYHPDRARERAIWLYNRIMSNRTCFVKVARKELRKRYKGNPSDIFRSFQFLTMKPSFKCLLCNVKLPSGGKFFKCDSPNCAGVYCGPCFGSLKFCSICTDGGDNMDFSDLSEERDSSDEDICRCSKPKPITSLNTTIKDPRAPKTLSLNLKKIKISLKDEPKKPESDCRQNSSLMTHSKFDLESAPPLFFDKNLFPQTILFTPKHTSDSSVQTMPEHLVPEGKKPQPKKGGRTLSEVESSDWEGLNIPYLSSPAPSETFSDIEGGCSALRSLPKEMFEEPNDSPPKEIKMLKNPPEMFREPKGFPKVHREKKDPFKVHKEPKNLLKVHKEPKDPLKVVKELEEPLQAIDDPRDSRLKIFEDSRDPSKKVFEEPRGSLEEIFDDQRGSLEEIFDEQRDSLEEIFEEPRDRLKEMFEKPKDPLKAGFEKPRDPLKAGFEKPRDPLKVLKEPKDYLKEPKDYLKEPKDYLKEPKDYLKEPKDYPKELLKEPKDYPKELFKEPKKSVLKKKHHTTDGHHEKAIRLFEKIPPAESETDWIKENQRQKRLRWKTPPSDSPPETEKKPNPYYRKKIRFIDDSSSDELQPSGPEARKSLMDLTSNKAEDEDEDEDEDEEKQDSDEETRRTIFASYWLKNKSFQEKFRSISYGLGRFKRKVSAGTKTPTSSYSGTASEPRTLATSDRSSSECSCLSTHRSRIFPFIDPLSICQFHKPTSVECQGMTEDEVEQNEVEIRDGLLSQERHRGPTICHTESCSCISTCCSALDIKKNTSTSSEVGDGQFYSQPYKSCDTGSQSTNASGYLKRAKARLNLNIHTDTFAKLYSVETDSSNENYLSVKPNRRVLGKLDWKRKWRWGDNSLAGLKGKPCRHYVKNRSDGKPSISSSWDGQVWEVEPHELERIPLKTRSEEHALPQNKRKKNRLSWAPDLISDLPLKTFPHPKPPESSTD